MSLVRWFIGERPFVIATCDSCGHRQSDHGASSVRHGRARFAAAGWSVTLPAKGRKASVKCPECGGEP